VSGKVFVTPTGRREKSRFYQWLRSLRFSQNQKKPGGAGFQPVRGTGKMPAPPKTFGAVPPGVLAQPQIMNM
jgi:hypothetical protein